MNQHKMLKHLGQEKGLIPDTEDHNIELQVYRSIDHMNSCKIVFFCARGTCMLLK